MPFEEPDIETVRVLIPQRIPGLPDTNFGNLTDTGTDGIVITGGTGAVHGAGTQIAQHVADATHNGYLSSTDWNTFHSGATGSVTSFSSGNLSPLFTTSVANPTTTPALSFAISNAAAHTFFANNTGSSGAPSFTSFVAGVDYQAALTIGNLTDAGTDGITVTGGTGAVIGSGTSLSQHVADTTHNGYLSSTDWNTFSGKQGALTFSDSIVNTAGTVTLVGDSASPSASNYYGTDSGSSLGFHALPTVSGQALTKTDDTNVTLTLGGSPSTALVTAASITLGWTGTLAVARGGTNAATASAHNYFGNNTGSTAAPGFHQIDYSELTGTPAAVTPAALTKTDDTNVTLTLGGTPATALLQATSLTLGWTGTLGPTRGGTGTGTYALGDTLYSDATNSLAKLSGNTTSTKKFLRQTGTGSVSAAPVWDTIVAADVPGSALTRTNDTNVTLTLGGTPSTALLAAASLTLGWTGTLAQSRGGTGLDTSGVTDGQLLIGQTSDNTFGLATLTAGANITITNAGHSISIASTASGGLSAPITQNDYATNFTIPTTGGLQQPTNTTLASTERMTIAGTGRETLFDPFNLPLDKGTYNPAQCTLRYGEYVQQYSRLITTGVETMTLSGDSRLFIRNEPTALNPAGVSPITVDAIGNIGISIPVLASLLIGGTAPVTVNDYGANFTIPDTGYLVQPVRATAALAERITIAGAGRDIIFDPSNLSSLKGSFNPAQLLLKWGEYALQFFRLTITGNKTHTFIGDARFILFDVAPSGRLTLAGSGGIF